jgi:hypothetical protein
LPPLPELAAHSTPSIPGQLQLPEVVERFSNDIYYHRGSPYSGDGKETTDRTFGDLHQVRSQTKSHDGPLLT